MSDNNVTMENKRPRVDVRERITGAVKFTADVKLPKMIYAKFVRFPYGVGKVKRANVEAAKKVPGILEVEIDTNRNAQYPGMTVGHIVGESRNAIEDAMEALDIRFTTEDPKTVAKDQYSGPPTLSQTQEKELAAIFKDAKIVIESTYETQVQTHSCLETHGAVIDHRGSSAEVWASTQGTFSYLDGIKGPCELDASKITVHNEYVGGGFGSKFSPDSEGDLCARLSKKFQRPCKIMLDRREEHLDAGNRPGSIQYMKLAASADGKILGGQIHCASIVGHTRGGGGVTNPSDQLYLFGNVKRTESEIQLNFSVPRAFRAPGHPQGVFAMEGMMDELAAKLDMDPIEIRKKNESSNRRRKQLNIGARAIGWGDRKPDGTWPGRIKRGYGVGGGMWYAWPTACDAEVDVHRSGQVEIRTGVQDIGTGTFTFVTDFAAHTLQIDRTMITTHLGNSKYPPGPGSGGSQVSRSVGPAVKQACERVLEDLRETVAHEWSAEVGDVEYGDGVFTKKGTEKKLAWKDACALISMEKISQRGGTKQGIEGSGTSDCVQFVIVDVDTETGNVFVRRVVAVHTCGIIANRLTAENQICGGVTQGVSFALFENIHLDPNTGAMMNADFNDYKIVGSKDMPEIVPILDVEESDTGVRSLGEPATIPTAGAIGNAVANAIGARVYSLPITPRKVLEALAAKGGRA